MKAIKIRHQLSKVEYKFKVTNPNKLTMREVVRICEAMEVQAIFVEGKYYRPE